jgi:hypothetical protein
MKNPHVEIEIPIPSFILVNAERHASVGLPTSSITLQDRTGISYLPIFRSHELATAILEKSKATLGGCAPLKLALTDIRALLVALSNTKCNHIGKNIDLERDGISLIHIDIIIDQIDAKLN